jgi:hypothetical protein
LEPVEGVAYFSYLMGELKRKYQRRIATVGAYDVDARLTPQFYGKLYQRHQAELGPYFRSLFHLFRFIDNSDRSKEEKIRYANFVRAQLSINETLLLFYNGTWGEGRDFRHLIERYGILKHIPSSYLLNASHIGNHDWYLVSAFQNAEDRRDGKLVPSETNARVSDDDFASDLEFKSI